MSGSLGLLASAYGDDDSDEETGASAVAAASTSIVVNAAPTVRPERFALSVAGAGGPSAGVGDRSGPNARTVFHNPEYEEMWAPVQGPSLTKAEQRAAEVRSKATTSIGHVAAYHPSSDYAFEGQYHTFNAYGFAADPSTMAAHHAATAAGPSLAVRPGVVGDLDKWAEARGLGVYGGGKRPLESKMEEQRRRLRLDEKHEPIPHAEAEISAEQSAAIAARHAKAKREREGRGNEDAPSAMEESSTFHGTKMTDYQGRSWLHPPPEARVDEEHECFIPKKWVHTWSGHTKGVAAIRWFPRTAHMLLSAGMDSKVKIWDVHNERKCMRTYSGHAAAVRDICFTSDGSRFVTCSYDRYLKLWDTETGQCISAVTNRVLPYCCQLHPDDPNTLLAGCSNKHIVQYDMRSGKTEQVYDQHLAAINTITFCEENRRFATTADDKKMLIWEFGIPVPIKHISDPTLHSMPAVTKSPNDKWLLCQNLDNQITTYTASDRFKLNRKKTFKGHVVAGYACQPGMSPDGNTVISGDTDGFLWCWDWKSCKVFRKIKCHDKVLITALWHPIEPSGVATCSWDGTIKYWE